MTPSATSARPATPEPSASVSSASPSSCGSGVGLDRALVHHGRAQQARRQAERGEDARGARVALDQQRQEHVLRPDVVVAEAERLAQGGLERSPSRRGLNGICAAAAPRRSAARRPRPRRGPRPASRRASRTRGSAAPGPSPISPSSRCSVPISACRAPAPRLGEHDDLAGLPVKRSNIYASPVARAGGRGPRRPPRSPRASWPR